MLLRAATIAVLAAVIGCRDTQQNTPSSGQPAADSIVAAHTLVPPPAWDSALGSFVGYGRDSEIVALLPGFTDGYHKDTTDDASSVNGEKVDLFGPTGFVGLTTVAGLGKSHDEEGCFEYSRGKVGGGSARWSVALPAGRATGIRLEGLADLHGADSSSLAGAVKTLAMTVPGVQDSIWRDWPLNIDYAIRFTVAGTMVIAGATTRILPGGQHFSQTVFFVGERPATADPNAPFVLAYSHPNPANSNNERSGLSSEDEVGVDAAVITTSNGRPILLLETHGNEVNGYAALGRVAPGRWAVTWSGPHEGGC